MNAMTKLLEQAIERARELPAEEQDALAEALFAYIANDDQPYRLTADQAEEVRRRQTDLRHGKTRLATDEEVEAVWKRCGL
jgi:putative addiction module component (TIGR02574 family)